MDDKDPESPIQIENVISRTQSPNAPISNKWSITDDNDGTIEWGIKSRLASMFLACLYVGSQIPLYFVGGSLEYMADDFGGAGTISWLSVSNTLAIAAVAPFCGSLQDIFGRRNITLFGCVLLMVGIVVLATGHQFGAGVAGMSVAGAGAAICELTALAGTAELVPVNKRGLYLGMVTFFIVPFCPYVLYCQLLSSEASWRWGQWICLIFIGLGTIGLFFTYFPESQTPIVRPGWVATARKIDYVGAVLSITGITLFLVALQSGGYSHPWDTIYVLSILIIGLALIVVWILWEWKFAKFPMVPGRIFQGQKIMGMAFCTAFVAGMNFYSLLNFFPLTFSNVYEPDPVQVGLKGLGYGFSVTLGASIGNVALSLWKGHNREILVVSCVIMTVFSGALACITPDNPKLATALGTISGFGVGGVLLPAATIAITVSPDELIATVVALALSIRVIGGSIGFTIYYNVFTSKLTPLLPEYVMRYASGAGLPASSLANFTTAYLSSPTMAQNITGVTPEIFAAASLGSRWAYSEALKMVWYISIPFGVLATIASFLIGNIELYMTNRIAAHIMT
ncbi:hypothetical protein BP5796_07668 [Coleophoma crateriformis]|uniref:Major facilitator superfamily (MFS) profile domain-containing protein n=1 Tax=Coleophoma crateriformis TaxID=565419 RepID=A0A3D8RJU4_9HELO|nr:hypothetical protein BP5796_07668 [Coleophoma crateriformis]